jgi:hypothetical protein
MRQNVQHLNTSIHEYASTGLNHAHEITRTIEQLQNDIRKLQL